MIGMTRLIFKNWVMLIFLKEMEISEMVNRQPSRGTEKASSCFPADEDAHTESKLDGP